MKSKGTVFIEHIQKHLAEGELVICKICNKSVEEIWEEYINKEYRKTTR